MNIEPCKCGLTPVVSSRKHVIWQKEYFDYCVKCTCGSCASAGFTVVDGITIAGGYISEALAIAAWNIQREKEESK